jgi:hypothetical protein
MRVVEKQINVIENFSATYNELKHRPAGDLYAVALTSPFLLLRI